jgi:catechol 2,3-dioxygenase-like lactoylglutathione lyase family enzyme
MQPYLEHLNMTSTDVEETIRFLLTAMPELRVRGSGGGVKAKHWVHVGTDESYLCIEDRGATEKGPHQPYVHPGMNHLGFVVRDGAVVAERLRAAGYREGSTYHDHPHRHRYYFFDHDDNEYEFVQYLSDDPAERNDYDL